MVLYKLSNRCRLIAMCHICIKNQGNFLSQKTYQAEKRERFNNQVKETTSFSDMGARLEDVITWCKSQGMQKEKVLLSFLRLKCRKMSNLETEGYK